MLKLLCVFFPLLTGPAGWPGRWRRLLPGALVVLLSATTALVSAQETRYQPTPERDFVQATGRAEIVYGDEYSARVHALRAAIERASLQGSARVRSDQGVENGALTTRYLRVQSAARVSNIEVLDEGPANGWYEVSIQARVSAEQTCGNHVINDYPKSLAVTNFPLRHAQQATEGHLGSVDTQLPERLVTRFSDPRAVRALSAADQRVLADTGSAPTRLTLDGALTRALAVDEGLGAQFILSGVVRDLAVYREPEDEAGADGLGAWLSQLWGGPRMRRLSLDVFVHDGLSGQLLTETRYETAARWPFASDEQVGFGTPEFDQSPYGQVTRDLLARVAQDVEQTLRCQPFMARITRVSGQRLWVAAGADSGLRPGDDLGVYRTVNEFGRRQTNLEQIVDTRVIARVVQVQPDFVVAEMPVDAARLNLQADDLVMAW